MEISASKKLKQVPNWVSSARFANWNLDTFSLTNAQAEKKASELSHSGVNAVILFWRGKGKEYRHIAFDSVLLKRDLTLRQCTEFLKQLSRHVTNTE